MTNQELKDERQRVLNEVRNDPANTLYGITMPTITRMIAEYRAAGLKLDTTLLEQAKANPFARSKVVNRCKDCKHFGPDQTNSRGWGICVLADGCDGHAEMAETLAFANDSEPHSAWLEVSPDFGCVQFEPKEQG